MRAEVIDPHAIVIPAGIRPSDGRFGSGPSKVPRDALDALAGRALDYMGTSHRRSGVRDVVGRIRSGLTELFGLPAGYEVVLGNGGATLLWDALVFSFVEGLSRHYVFGEFSSKFAAAVAAAPHLDTPEIVESAPGSHPAPEPSETADVYALTHNETSTGVVMPVLRPDRRGLVAVDATSAAGGIEVDPRSYDVYYFAPQKCFASDGGLWIALCSPEAVARIEAVTRSRYVPAILDVGIALHNSRSNQTYNTPALATLFLLLYQLEWTASVGGLEAAAARSRESSGLLYDWAERSQYARPYVADPAMRSPVVATIDFAPEIDAGAVAAVLRANGIVDTEPYRKLGRNQLRIATYPAIEPGDVAALARCIEFAVEAMS